MGFLSRLVKSAPEQSDAQIELIKELLADQRQQRSEMSKLLDRVLDQQATQMQLMNKMMTQYIAVGENQTTTLDSRLFAKDEKIEEDMWEPVGFDPFKQLGLTD